MLQLTERDCRMLLLEYHARLSSATTDMQKSAVRREYEPLIDKGVCHRKRRACISAPLFTHVKNRPGREGRMQKTMLCLGQSRVSFLPTGFHPHLIRPDREGCTRKNSADTCRSEADALNTHAVTRSHELLEHMHACTRAHLICLLRCQLGYLHDCKVVCLFHTFYTTALSNTPLLCSTRAV